MANTQQSMSLTNIQTTVNMSVVVIGAQKLETQLTGIRAKIATFKKSMEDSGLGKLDVGAFIKGGGLLDPFISGIKKAIKAENEFEDNTRKTAKLKAPEVSLGKTATNLKQFNDAMDDVSLKMGQALLPAVNSVVTALTPMISAVGEFVANNPSLVEGLAAAAVAFTVVTTGAMGAAAVLGLLASPIGIIAAVVAVAAGLIVAYWKPISGFFSGIWKAMQGAAESTFSVFRSLFNWKPLEALAKSWGAISGFVSELWVSVGEATAQTWDAIKSVFDWSPMAIIEGAWAPFSEFFGSLWEGVKAVAAPVIDFFKTLFSWHPLVIVANNWQPLVGLFSAIWDLLRALAVPVMSFFKKLFDWSPLGMVINNWKPLVGFFSATWDVLRALAAPVVDFFKGLFDWSPMALVSAVWDPLSNYFSGLWQTLEVMAQPVVDFFKSLFDWSPMAQVSAAWEPLSGFFSGLWDSLTSVTAPVGELFKTLFDWSPMEMVTANWTPIIAWFSGLWEKLKAIIEPIKDLFGGSFSGFIAKITGKVEGLTEAQQKTNAEGKGELAPAFFGASNDQSSLSSDLPKGSNALVQQSAANNRAQLEGGLTVRFENAPAGMRTDQPQTNQPGLAMTSQIGYRSLSLGGSNELA
jgi:phage-related protein